MKKLLIVSTILWLFFSSLTQKTSVEWIELEPGLEYTSTLLSEKSTVGDSKVDILRINPKYFDFQLLSAKEKNTPSKVASAWASQNNLIALVNAGMFKLEGDMKTCTGYMKNYSYVNNPVLTPSYKNMWVFNAKDSSVPAVQIIDLNCENWKQLQNKYHSFAQGLRMLNCEQEATWQQDYKKWSMVLAGEDQQQNILFIFVRSPYTVRNYTNQLKSLGMGITRLMYLEGGPEASFYLNHPKMHLEKMGSYETGFNENDNNKEYWQLPNVIGIKRKK